MRRLLLILAIAVAVVLGAMAIVLPRLAARPEVRERLVEEARKATGRELAYDELDVGLFPPRLEVTGAQLAPLEGQAPLGAERVALRVAWLPLLARQILIRRVDVEGAELTVRRTADGFELPFTPQEEEPEEEPEKVREEPETPKEDNGFSLLVQQIRIRDTTIRLADETVEPAADLVLALDVADIEIEDLAGAASFELDGRIGDAPLTGRGRRGSGGALEANLSLDRLELAMLQPWINDEDFAGTIEAKVDAKLQRQTVESLVLRAKLNEAVVIVGDVVAKGPIPVNAELSGELDALTGPVSLDLTDADLSIDETFTKAAGTPGRLGGRLVQTETARSLEDLELELHNMKAYGRAELSPNALFTLDAEPFELAGWQKLLPALGESAPAGTLALKALRIETGPIQVHGDVIVDGLVLPLENNAVATLSGKMTGTGDAIEGKDLDLRVAEQVLQLALAVEQLSKDPSLRLRLDADEVETQVLLAALAGKEDTLSGPLRLRSDLRGPLTGEGSLMERLKGKLRFDIRPGRLKGVSLLKSTFDGLGKTGGAALAAGRLSGDKRAERFYEDEFQRAGGTLNLSAGRASTKDLRLDYQHYRVDLRGSVGLIDRALDLTGKLTIFEEIDGIISDESGRPVKRVIPLASVTGTVEEPRVSVTSEAALGFAAAYVADDRRREKWEKKLDKKLGEGSGKEVLNLLDSILNGTGEPIDDSELPPPGEEGPQ